MFRRMIASIMRQDLPAGTVTFLFTDVEGSTKLLHELGAETFAEALAEHRRVIRETCTAKGGVEVDTQGDAFFFAFSTAPGAVAAASALTEALASGQVQVRVGLHTGTPLLTDEGYVGEDVHRAARIAASGHGGQVLASASTAPLVELELRDLGEHRFKDLTAPERVFQLGQGDFPPLKTLHQTNLPIPQTPFLGREKELGEVLSLLVRDDVRLLTLTGPGGTGKTRLAAQAAGALADRYPHGVFWVPLAPVRDPVLVLESASQVLGAKDGLASHIADKRMLLLFDNFEQVIEAAPGLSALLGDCPHLELLVTSREALHLAGEQEYPVPPFAPEEGVGFFAARARAAKPDFAIDEAVPEICRRLDELPLALELAAARVKALSTEQILSRLEQRLPLLTGGPRDVPQRQRTLRATIEWSYELLTPEEQRLFVLLSAFSGGCTFEAANEVTDADLDTLQSLVDKSLLRYSDDRYWMLETIREYARERLEESMDEPLRDRHANFFLQFAESAEAELTGADQPRWLERLADEHENLRVALERFLGGDNVERALRLASSLVVFWYVRGYYGEGRAWLERVLADPLPDESPALAKALWGAGFLGVLSNEYDSAPARLEHSLAVARRVNDPSTLARCLDVLGLLAFFRDEVTDARALLEESIDAAGRAGDFWCLADALGTLGSICPLQGDLEAAEAAGHEALSIARPAGDQHGVRMALFGLALTALRRGDAETAHQFADEGLAVSRGISDPWFTSYFQWLLACAALDRGDLESARPAAEDALDIALQAGGALLIVCAREALARVEWVQGNQAAAHRQLEDALEAAVPGGVPASYISAVELTLGRLMVASGDRDAARTHVEASLALATRVGDTWSAKRAEETLTELRSVA
jgi:predicted ATPase/class 3 adenylate cyclase